jgi:hypothetical protein
MVKVEGRIKKTVARPEFSEDRKPIETIGMVLKR